MNPLPISEWLAGELDLQAPRRRKSAAAQGASAAPRYRQLYEALRRAILDQRLASGERLPSTRELAEELGLSRNTVVNAIEQLLAEGYVVAQTGSGTYVADLAITPRRTRAVSPAPSFRGLAERGQRLLGTHSGVAQEIQPFVPGNDDFSLFPTKLWQRLQNRYWRENREVLFDYGPPGGYVPLRAAIARYIELSRAVRVTPEQIVITSGTQHSIQLCAQLLANAGDIAWVEDPGYWGARKALGAADLQLQPIAVDAHGLNLAGAETLPAPRLIYVTPSHHYPTSAVMSLPRRHALLDYAAERGAWILEDDYDSEFRYSGRPLSSLQGLDTHDCVIYLGTFSKSLFPGIKLAYLVAPPALAEAFRTAHYDLHRPGQLSLQATLADFIDHGHFATHMRKVRQAYGERRDILVRTLKPILGKLATLSKEASGLHLLIELPKSANDVALAALIATEGLVVRPLSSYYLGAERRKGLLVGYAYVPTREVARHARRLGEVIKRGLRSYG